MLSKNQYEHNFPGNAFELGDGAQWVTKVKRLAATRRDATRAADAGNESHIPLQGVFCVVLLLLDVLFQSICVIQRLTFAVYADIRHARNLVLCCVVAQRLLNLMEASSLVFKV